MVTKLKTMNTFRLLCLILAKNHMVTKLNNYVTEPYKGLILAKNHMVTKRLLIFGML